MHEFLIVFNPSVTKVIFKLPIGMKKLVLINAIVWATIILVASFLFKEVPNYKYFFLALVFSAGLMNMLIHKYAVKPIKARCK